MTKYEGFANLRSKPLPPVEVVMMQASKSERRKVVEKVW